MLKMMLGLALLLAVCVAAGLMETAASVGR
jgi:hypothetical protein